ncbi:MAG: prepilin peptidase [Opitutales bacterium]|mgnify:CR=1 FL=1|jgi:leader peptidase (prepilin peptidase) / N-methyltransferase|nr:prepilin peptidase [Opitutales bacterium]MDG2254579.1 prepilin peptidase [Opitutaceae bacterium]MBT5168900.1 prepilin peptidase [Opitutales bacterium]MBT5814069.1 prepilin peptidase [Opitutales bacterium]MBT6378972.1 prepilin peptidase [Opitutales bacterium]
MLSDFKAIDQEFPAFFASMIFIFGAIVGSFLNVCIYRIPDKKSIVHPGSTCACGKPISWYDNIPIFSWFILRGKARCCNAPYSFRYPFIESLTAGLFLAAWLQHPHAKAACLLLFISLMICATFIDFDHMEIPDRFSYGAALFGTILSVAVPSLHGFQDLPPIITPIKGFFEAIIGIMIGSGLILWIALASEAILRKEAMGFGDVKLLGGIGAFAGWQGAVFALFGGAVIGTIGLGLWLMIKAIVPSLRKKTVDNSEKNGGGLVGKQMPFGPMLAAGALLYLLLLEKEVDQYFAIAIDLVQQQ